ELERHVLLLIAWIDHRRKRYGFGSSSEDASRHMNDGYAAHVIPLCKGETNFRYPRVEKNKSMKERSHAPVNGRQQILGRRDDRWLGCFGTLLRVAWQIGIFAVGS